MLKWFVLAGLSRAVLRFQAFAAFNPRGFSWNHQDIYSASAKQLAHLGLALPGIFWIVIRSLKRLFIATWYQDIALRLGLWRSLLWLACCPIAYGLLTMARFPFGRDYGVTMFWNAGPAIAGVALIGRRTRPWMTVVANVPAFIAWLGTVWFDREIHSLPEWLMFALTGLPYALVMIYGTQPLGQHALTGIPLKLLKTHENDGRHSGSNPSESHAVYEGEDKARSDSHGVR